MFQKVKFSFSRIFDILLLGLKKQKENYSKGIQKDTIEAAVYLDNRTNFWYRQNPRIVTDINKKTYNQNNNCDFEKPVHTVLPPINCNRPFIAIITNY